MESVCSLKRHSSETEDLCIICQDESKERLVEAGEQGHQTLRNCATIRHKLKDSSTKVTVDRILNSVSPLKWHRSCYSWFTNKSKLKRLENHVAVSEAGCSSGPGNSLKLRSTTATVNFNLCLFCQTNLAKKTLHNVETLNTSEKIIEAVKYDHNLSVALAECSDLIAAECKYHLLCYSKYMRNVQKTELTSKQYDMALAWLSMELEDMAIKSHILELDEVWKRYCILCEDADISIPSSFQSRLSSFKEKLVSLVGNLYEFHVIYQQGKKCTVLVPKQFSHMAISHKIEENIDETTIPVYQVQDDVFLSLIHVAMRLRSDILSGPTYEGATVSKFEVLSCIPDSLYMFFRILYGGHDAIEKHEDESVSEGMDDWMLSAAQDIIYGVTKGRHKTPKHVGLSLSLHQATRSKKLLDLFHKAGHTLAYKDVLNVDTAMAQSVLQDVDPDTGGIIPQNLAPDRFIHFSAYNIDILDASLDGKNTFHATQMTAWQRGPPVELTSIKHLHPTAPATLTVPENFSSCQPPEHDPSLKEPVLAIDEDWFLCNAKPHTLSEAEAKEMVFTLKRSKQTLKQGWTNFNKEISTAEFDKTTIGYMPIILAPAHEFDTLNTVVKRCKYVAEAKGQKYVVLTVDEALYCRLMELKWANPTLQQFLIPRLGGLHTAMNFIKAIGQHMQSTGLEQLWIDSGLLGSKSAANVLDGKGYEKAVRSHKITSQAIWQIVLPKVLGYLQNEDDDLIKLLDAAVDHNDDIALQNIFQSKRYEDLMSAFIDQQHTNVNFLFWWQYLDMVQVLLMFIRAQRDALWELHLQAFKRMLPYFHRYDHTNYAKWGIIYMAEMKCLPKEVEEQFQAGHFVVKASQSFFNQVDPDHAQEWLNGVCKKSGGIIGITKTASALTRWSLSFTLRAKVCEDTQQLFGMTLDQSLEHKEVGQSRKQKDMKDEENIVETLKKYEFLGEDQSNRDVLENIATKDQATTDITESLLQAEARGLNQVQKFVTERFAQSENVTGKKKFFDPLSKNKPPTMSNMYQVSNVNETNGRANKIDRSIMQRLVIALEAGRKVDLQDILRYELMPVPLSIAELNGNLRTGSKSLLVDELTKEVHCPASVTITGSATLIIDGLALVQSLDQVRHLLTFGDYAAWFSTTVFQAASSFCRVDVVFDRYNPTSVKAGTRDKRKRGNPIRRLVRHDVPLPHDWHGFLSNADNKADLTNFLSEQLILQAPDTKVVVVAGGFAEENKVCCNKDTLDIDFLKATHEEADTRVVLHCIHSATDSVVVAARDTDILILLLAHSPSMRDKVVWMKAGTYKKPKFIPVKDVIQANNFDNDSVRLLLALHAITGSDTTSFLYGKSKKTALRMFMDQKDLLKDLGKEPLTEGTMANAEKFLCHLYGVSEETTDKARVTLFKKAKQPEFLPPTSDATRLHIKRSHLQTAVWLQADCPSPVLPAAEDMGWQLLNGKLSPLLLTLPPVPKSCQQLITCGCTTGCANRRCKCRKAELYCTGTCRCESHCLNVDS